MIRVEKLGRVGGGGKEGDDVVMFEKERIGGT